MKTVNAFADHMHVSRPPFLILFIIPTESDTGLINIEGVKPDVHTL